MSTVATVWLIVALVSTAAVVVVLIGLVRHVLVLGRALGRFQREVEPIASTIAAEGERATSRTRPLHADTEGRARDGAVR